MSNITYIHTQKDGWCYSINQLRIKEDTPTVFILKSIDKFDYEVLNNYLETASAYGQSQSRLESAEKALEHPEKFKNKPQILENYKKLKKEHLTNYLAHSKNLERLKDPLGNELCYYSTEDLTLIYRKKYEEVLKEQRRVSSILDNKKAKRENVTQEFATLRGLQFQKFYLKSAFIKIVNIVKIRDEFAHLRTKNKEPDSKIAKRGQRQEDTSKVKGNYIAPIIPKKKKWKDLVDEDRDF